MTLDVVVPTYNRSALLRKTLDSFLNAERPAGLDVTVCVIDNNSPDDTADVVQEYEAKSTLPIRYIHEKKQGLSNARNAGILASSADLVGFIDDDEEIHPDWLKIVAHEFADPTIQFIGGPYLPNWVSPVPDWLPPGYPAVIGEIPPKPRAVFDEQFSGNLMGGNAVLRRALFDQVGMYAPHLGRSNKGLLSEEDAELYGRLRKAGIKGLYVPELAIYHYIAPSRLTRTYHRRWVLWRAVSKGLLDREKREPVTYLAGVPRYKIGVAVRSLLAIPKHRVGPKGKAQAFADELKLWDLAGFFYGKFLFRAQSYYAER